MGGLLNLRACDSPGTEKTRPVLGYSNGLSLLVASVIYSGISINTLYEILLCMQGLRDNDVMTGKTFGSVRSSESSTTRIIETSYTSGPM